MCHTIASIHLEHIDVRAVEIGRPQQHEAAVASAAVEVVAPAAARAAGRRGERVLFDELIDALDDLP